MGVDPTLRGRLPHAIAGETGPQNMPLPASDCNTWGSRILRAQAN